MFKHVNDKYSGNVFKINKGQYINTVCVKDEDMTEIMLTVSGIIIIMAVLMFSSVSLAHICSTRLWLGYKNTDRPPHQHCTWQ